MNARQLQFIKPGIVEIIDISIQEPGLNEVLVQALYSGISPGTERLAYRGEFPSELLLDESINELQHKARYPFTYGYILIGIVQEAGSRENQWMVGKKVLVFHPHQDRIVVDIERLIFIPDELSPELSSLIPNCETALTFIQDAAPLMGERVCLYGLGVVGQISARMLASFPLEELVLIDPSLYRRDFAQRITGVSIYSASSEEVLKKGFDLTLELSGNPSALQSAVSHSGYAGRILVGSWYGNKTVSLDLGSRFHRKRLQIFSSQVSTIAPGLRGRWDYKRRIKTSMNWLINNQESSWITHIVPFEDVSTAYEIINVPGGDYLQVLLDMR